MRGEKKISFLNGVTTSPALLVLLKIGLDLLFKLLCYFLVYKFYVYVKPRFCRRPVLPKKMTESNSTKEGETRDLKKESKQDEGDTKENDSTEPLESLDEDEFVKAAEELLQTIKTRKAYNGSQTIQDLHARLRQKS